MTIKLKEKLPGAVKEFVNKLKSLLNGKLKINDSVAVTTNGKPIKLLVEIINGTIYISPSDCDMKVEIDHFVDFSPTLSRLELSENHVKVKLDMFPDITLEVEQ